MLRKDQNNLDALYLRGLTFMHTGNPPSAIKHFKNILQLDPDNVEARSALKVRSFSTLR